MAGSFAVASLGRKLQQQFRILFDEFEKAMCRRHLLVCQVGLRRRQSTDSAAGSATAAVRAPANSFAAPPDPGVGLEESRSFAVGVMGAGRIGRVHLQNVLSHRRLRLQWVVDDSADAVQQASRQLLLHDTPFHTTTDIPLLLKDPGLDGVLVLTPTATHSSLVRLSLEHGKAVFVEKPTAETREEIQQCYDLAQQNGIPLCTGFQRRFDPVMRDLYDSVVLHGAVGSVRNIKTVSRDSPRPSYSFLKACDPMGCNILSDMAVHDVDLVVWLTQGQEPEFIYVITHSHDAELAEAGIADSITVLLKYKSGIIVTIDSCRETTYGYDVRVEVFGSDGMVTAENPRETTSVRDGAGGGRVRRLFHSFPERFEKAFQLQLQHFVNCMAGSEKPLVTTEQAVLTARIIEKGLQSFSQKAPVYF